MTKRERDRLLRMAAHFRGPFTVTCTAFFEARGPIGDWLRREREISRYHIAASVCESLAYDNTDGPQ